MIKQHITGNSEVNKVKVNDKLIMWIQTDKFNSTMGIHNVDLSTIKKETIKVKGKKSTFKVCKITFTTTKGEEVQLKLFSEDLNDK